MNHKVHWIGCEIYPVHVGVCFDEKAFLRELNKGGIEDKAKHCIRWVNPRGATTHTFSKIWMPPANKNAAIITLDISCLHQYWPSTVASMIAHEAIHVKNFIEKCIGEDKFSDEAEAYLVQLLTRNALHTLAKHYKPKMLKE